MERTRAGRWRQKSVMKSLDYLKVLYAQTVLDHIFSLLLLIPSQLTMPFWNLFWAVVITSVLFNNIMFDHCRLVWLLANFYNNLESSLLAWSSSAIKLQLCLSSLAIACRATEWRRFPILANARERVRSDFIVEELKASVQCVALFAASALSQNIFVW